VILFRQSVSWNHHGADLESADLDFDHLAAVGETARLTQARDVD